MLTNSVKSIPTWSNYASHGGDALDSGLWRGLTNAWIPGLGPTGNKLIDLGGQKRHGTMSGSNWDPDTGWLLDPELGWVLDLDGNSTNGAYVDLGTWDIRNPSLKDVSIGIWFRADTFTPSDARIISKATGTAEANHWWMMGLTSTERVRFRLKAGGTTRTIVAFPNTVSTSTWYFITMVRDFGQTFPSLYIDGSDKRTGATAINAGDLDEDDTVGINIGRNPDGYGEFNGRIGPTMIWNRALKHSEVLELAGDPYALVRPRPVIVAVVAPAPGGLSIPVAMHSYRQRHQSII